MKIKIKRRKVRREGLPELLGWETRLTAMAAAVMRSFQMDFFILGEKEIPRVSGAPCQDLGPRQAYMSFMRNPNIKVTCPVTYIVKVNPGEEQENRSRSMQTPHKPSLTFHSTVLQQ